MIDRENKEEFGEEAEQQRNAVNKAAQVSSSSKNVSDRKVAELVESVQHIDQVLTQLVGNLPFLGEGVEPLPPGTKKKKKQ